MAAKRPRTPGAFGEPSSKLLELFSETVAPEPYPVTDKIVVQPLTKTSLEKLSELQNKRMIGNYVLAEALRRTGDQAPTDADLAELTKIVNDADLEYNRLFFGGQYEAILEFFADRPPAHWDAFCKDIRQQFIPSAPASGKCPHCANIIDLDAAGKALASST